MKRILKKRIIPLLCAGLLLCAPHHVVFALEGGIPKKDATVRIEYERVEEKPPTVEEKPPPVEEKPPPAEEKPPPAEEKPPPAEETSPPVEETSPPVEETAPPVEETSPPVEETAPPVEETSPPVEETSPPVEETSPPVEEISPPVEETLPPEEETPPTGETVPPVEETLPPTEESKPEVTTPEELPEEELPEEKNGEPVSYSVEIGWERLEFDYAPVWNPDEHCYDGWESTKNPITVTNMTENSAPFQVTLTFVPIVETGTVAVFSPGEDDPNPEDFTISDGQITFWLPRDMSGETQATVNLSLAGAPVGFDIEQYTQIGAIKTEIVSLHDMREALEGTPSDVVKEPIVDDSVPETTAPVIGESAEESTQESMAPSEPALTELNPDIPETLPPQLSQAETEQPPATTEGKFPSESEVKKPPPEQQEITPDVVQPPEDETEESQAAPPEESAGPPQEEPQ